MNLRFSPVVNLLFKPHIELSALKVQTANRPCLCIILVFAILPDHRPSRCHLIGFKCLTLLQVCVNDFGRFQRSNINAARYEKRPKPKSVPSLTIKRNHFPKDVILFAVYFHIRYAMSYHDLQENIAERGVTVDHSILNRWVVKFSLLVAIEAQMRKALSKRSWRKDEGVVR